MLLLLGAPGGPVNLKLLDLIRAPYVLYGVKYIDLVSLAPFSGRVLVPVQRA